MLGMTKWHWSLLSLMSHLIHAWSTATEQRDTHLLASTTGRQRSSSFCVFAAHSGLGYSFLCILERFTITKKMEPARWGSGFNLMGVVDCGSTEMQRVMMKYPLRSTLWEHHFGRGQVVRSTNTLERHSLSYGKAHTGRWKLLESWEELEIVLCKLWHMDHASFSLTIFQCSIFLLLPWQG